MPMIDKYNMGKAIALATELIEIPKEQEFGCSIEKDALDQVLTEHGVELPDGSLLHALFIGKIFSIVHCNFNRLTDIAHYYYHLFCGDAPSLVEILADDDGSEERVVSEGTDTVH